MGRRESAVKHDEATAYADDVLHGSLVAGPHVRAECQRHLNDIKPETCSERGWAYNLAAVKNVLSFFPNVLTLLGDYEGEPFELKRFQKFILGRIFGFEMAGGKRRRFRYAYVETSRGSGKTPLAAGVALYMLCFDGAKRGEVYICAAGREQALITFKDVVGMVQQSSYLSQRIPDPLGGERYEKLVDPQTGSVLKALAFHPKGRGVIGTRPHCAIVDELHEHPTDGMLEAMTSGFKKDLRALCLMLTNSGVDKESVCYHERDLAIRAARGHERRLDNRMAYVCAVDEGDDPLDETTWVKTNPSLNPPGRADAQQDTGIPTFASMRERRDTAVMQPSKMSAFLRFNCCTWTESYGSWLGKGVWQEAVRAGADLKLDDYRGEECFGGVDLALRRCMAAVALVFRSTHSEYAYDVFAMFWLARDVLLEAERRDHREGLYQRWLKEGHLRAPPGITIDYRDIARYLADIGRDHAVRGMAFDRRYVETLLMEFPRMEAPPSYPLVPHPQGFAAPLPSDPGEKDGPKLYMPVSVKRTELLLRQNRIRIAPNPILTSHVAASVAVPNPRMGKGADPERAEEVRLAVASPSEYNDGAIAMVQAIGYAEAVGAEPTGPLIEFW